MYCTYACMHKYVHIYTYINMHIHKNVKFNDSWCLYWYVRYNPYVMVSRNTETSVPVYTNHGLVIMHVFIIGVLTQILNQITVPKRVNKLWRILGVLNSCYCYRLYCMGAVANSKWTQSMTWCQIWVNSRISPFLKYDETEALCRMIPGDKRSCLQLLAIASIRYLIFTVSSGRSMLEPSSKMNQNEFTVFHLVGANYSKFRNQLRSR